MPHGLAISLGQHSESGRKPRNQDFHGALVPEGADLALKGVAIALADGISSSAVGGVAAEMAVKSFLTQYYSASDAWTVETAAQRVIAATNAWLHGETRRAEGGEDPDRGYVCTFTAVVLKARTAHVFHVGDSAVFRLAGETLEPLTEPHRTVVDGRSYLGRALGVGRHVAIDYRQAPLAAGDVLVLCTDGVHEHLTPRAIARCIVEHADDLDRAAAAVAAAALESGSPDNLTVQVVRIERLPPSDAADLVEGEAPLPAAPMLEPPCEFEGYRVLKRIHASHRSHVYLAEAARTGARVAIKAPAVELRADPALLRQFMMEEWIARRVESPHLVRALPPRRARRFLYTVMEHVEGISLRQWMYDHPAPDLEAVRGIVSQLVKGLRALHRKQIVHRDLRPENVIVQPDGTVKIIDFGSARVAGVVEAAPDAEAEALLGTLQYTAPECLAGEPASWRSDLYSLGAIAYEMLTGSLPYGARAARVRSRGDLAALAYDSATSGRRGVPAWIDGALRTAVHPDPSRRHQALSEFEADLRTPNPRFARSGFTPLAERDPLKFWQATSVILLLVVLALLARLAG